MRGDLVVNTEKLMGISDDYQRKLHMTNQLYEDVYRAKKEADPADYWQYDKLLRQINRLSDFFYDMHKVSFNTAEDVAEVIRELHYQLEEMNVENRRIMHRFTDSLAE